METAMIDDRTEMRGKQTGHKIKENISFRSGGDRCREDKGIVPDGRDWKKRT